MLLLLLCTVWIPIGVLLHPVRGSTLSAPFASSQI
jgi:hypothetical protein